MAWSELGLGSAMCIADSGTAVHMHRVCSIVLLGLLNEGFSSWMPFLLPMH